MQAGVASFRGRGDSSWRGGATNTRGAHSVPRGRGASSGGGGRGRGDWMPGGRGRGRGRGGRGGEFTARGNRRGGSSAGGSQNGAASGSDTETGDDGDAMADFQPVSAAEREKRFSSVTDKMAVFEQMKKEREATRKRLIREGKIDDPDVPKPLSEAIPFVGECPDMCPQFERVTRAVQNGLDTTFELGPDGQVSKDRAVKIFHRPAAGIEAQLPSDVRPPPVLIRTLHYLINDIIGGPYEFNVAHPFVRDRTRGIRQDFVLQNYRGDEAVLCHEEIARFHIASLHKRAEDKRFEQYQEMEQLLKVLTSLAEFYHDTHEKNKAEGLDHRHPNEAEFRAYQLIGRLRDPAMEREVLSWPQHVHNSPEVQHALNIYETAQRSTDADGSGQEAAQHLFGTFFKLIKSEKTTYLQACLAETQFNDIRRLALKAMKKSYRPNTKNLRLADVTRLLAYESEEHARRDLEAYGVFIGETEVVREGQPPEIVEFVGFEKRGEWIEPNPPLPHSFHTELVESKLDQSLPSLIMKASPGAPAMGLGASPASKLNPSVPAFKPITSSPFANGDISSTPAVNPSPFGQGSFGNSPFGSAPSPFSQNAQTSSTGSLGGSSLNSTANPFKNSADALKPGFGVGSPSPFASTAPATNGANTLPPQTSSSAFASAGNPAGPSNPFALSGSPFSGATAQATPTEPKQAIPTAPASWFPQQLPKSDAGPASSGEAPRSLFDSVPSKAPITSFTPNGSLFSQPTPDASPVPPAANGVPAPAAESEADKAADKAAEVARAAAEAKEKEAKLKLQLEAQARAQKEEEARKAREAEAARLRAEAEAREAARLEAERQKRAAFEALKHDVAERIRSIRARKFLAKLWWLKCKKDKEVALMEAEARRYYARRLAEMVFYPWKREAAHRRHRREGEARRANPRTFNDNIQFTPVPSIPGARDQTAMVKEVNWTPIALHEIFIPQVHRAFSGARDGDKSPPWGALFYNNNPTDQGSLWFGTKFLGHPNAAQHAANSPEFEVHFFTPHADFSPVTVDQAANVGALVFGCSADYEVPADQRFQHDKTELHKVVSGLLQHTRFERLLVSVICYRAPADSKPADPFGRDKKRVSGPGRDARIRAIEAALQFSHLAKAVLAEVVLVENIADLQALPARMAALAKQIPVTVFGEQRPRRTSPKRKLAAAASPSDAAPPTAKKTRALPAPPLANGTPRTPAATAAANGTRALVARPARQQPSKK